MARPDMKFDGCHGNVKNDTRSRHVKRFAGNEGTANKSFSALD